MTERSRRSTPAPAAGQDGSAVPARLRIVGWIVLATALGLLAVVVTLRSTLTAELERTANAEVLQEVDEFRTFADRGRDPETGGRIASPTRLLQLYLERQYPGDSELLLGFDGRAADAGRNPLLLQDVRSALQPTDAEAVVRELVATRQPSGTVEIDGTPVRWGRVDVEPDAAFLVLQSTGPGLAQLARITRLVLLVSALCLLGTAGIAWVVAGQILAPVRLVRRAASRITQTDLSERIEVRGRDDVAALAVVFNAMLNRLQDAFSGQRRLSRAANAHLRVPLETLRRRTADDRESGRALDQVDAVLDDLEVLAAAGAPEFVTPAPVDVAALTERLCSRAAAAGGRCTVAERAETTAVLDAERVEQAVLRLVRNAVQASGHGAPVRIGSRLDGDAVELYVADDGPGLPDELAARVLERFGESSPSGPGLGLAVVRSVADAHAGSVWLETAEGEGSTFGLRLPLLAAPVEAVPNADLEREAVPA